MSVIRNIWECLCGESKEPVGRQAVVAMTAPPAAEHENPLLLGEEEVAGLLGLSAGAVRRLAAGGKLPEPVRVGNFHRWRRTEIESWVADGCPTRESWAWPRSA